MSITFSIGLAPLLNYYMSYYPCAYGCCNGCGSSLHGGKMKGMGSLCLLSCEDEGEERKGMGQDWLVCSVNIQHFRILRLKYITHYYNKTYDSSNK